jgi:succinate dehydrogenase / fumarate reductase, flavoprotein subunit
VARCIMREVRQGRGSPHGGVFLDISWIKSKLPDAEAHIKRKLPSMHHQFKQLADIDITREAMEVGPTTHYVMGGVLVDSDTQMTSVPGLFACGECASGINGANRLGGNSLSDLLVFGKRAGEYAAKYAKTCQAAAVDPAQVEDTARRAVEPFERYERPQAVNPYQVQSELQELMQDLVGIVRTEAEMLQALDKIEELKRQAAQTGVPGNREYNNGWHTALDLDHLLTVSEAIARAGLVRKESRGAHFREDYPEKDQRFAKSSFVLRKGEDGRMRIDEEPIPEMPEDLRRIIEEMK